MLQLFDLVKNSLHRTTKVAMQLNQEVYSKPCSLIANASIGSHVRHIIEFYQCLLKGYESGKINYDERKRNIDIEQNTKVAKECVQVIVKSIEKPDKELSLTMDIQGENIEISSNYYRELLYNLEHNLHHEALIRTAIESMSDLSLPKEFGFAPSTLRYQNECAS